MNQLLPFLFEHLPIRGAVVRLQDTWQEVLKRRHYPPEVAHLLGESLGAVALLGSTIKFEGTLSLQLQGEGAVPLLIAQNQANKGLRGLARWRNSIPQTEDLRCLAGEAARLVITIDLGRNFEQYQGLVEIKSPNLGMAVADYFAHSEQLPTVLKLHSTQEDVVGILLQKLPSEALVSWETYAAAVLAALPDQLFDHPNFLLSQLFPQDDLRIFEPQPLHFHCNCSLERTQNMILSLGQAELQTLLDERGQVSITCEFCGFDYVFDRTAILQLFHTSDSEQD